MILEGKCFQFCQYTRTCKIEVTTIRVISDCVNGSDGILSAPQGNTDKNDSWCKGRNVDQKSK